MRTALATLGCGLALAALGAAAATAAPARATVLTPAEQKWIAPLLKIWNVQNQGLQKVIQQALAKNALEVGEKPQNLALTNTLVALADCKQPKDLIKSAGPPPTSRLKAFRSALNAACIHDQNGVNDFAKAIAAVTKNQSSRVTVLLTQGGAEFRKGSTYLTKAYKAVVAVGGKTAFKA
jgi:hypothetical protein